MVKMLDGAMSVGRATALVRQYGRFAVEDAIDTVKERGNTVTNPAGFLVRLLARRSGNDGDHVAAAEGLFLSLHSDEGRPLLSWKRSQELVHRYGARAVSDVLRAMRSRDDILNPVGFVLSSLKRNAQLSNPTNVKTREDAIETLHLTFDAIEPKHAVSRGTARRLVDQYGVKSVMRALSVVQARENIENPAGFVISFLRSEAKSPRRRHLKLA
ncbi:MAG: hypothetical protein AAF125_08905 [Chloroflexota bacterium]